MSNPRFIRFALEKDYAVHTVPNRFDFSDEEKSQVWFTGKEYDNVKQNVKRAVSRIEDGSVFLTECTRGLEGKTKQGSMNKQVAVLDGICAVLLEQERQRQDRRDDVQSIRAVYIEQTQIHANAALEQGMKDADYENEEEAAPFVQKQLPRTRGRGRIQRLLFKRSGDPSDLKMHGRS
jgi:hypothetical protein